MLEEVSKKLSGWADAGIKSHSEKFSLNFHNFKWQCREELRRIEHFVLLLETKNQAALARRLESAVTNAYESLKLFDRSCVDGSNDYRDHDCLCQEAKSGVYALAGLLRDITAVPNVEGEEIMPRNIPIGRQLEQQLTTVKDALAKWADGTHRLRAVLLKQPSDTKWLEHILGAVAYLPEMAHTPGDNTKCCSFSWLKSEWHMSITGQPADLVLYPPLASDCFAVVSKLDEAIPNMRDLIPIHTRDFGPVGEYMGELHWTSVLFWLALTVHDMPLLRAKVFAVDKEKPHSTGYSMRSLPAGITPDSPDWPEIGFAHLNCDLFTASVRACDWLLTQLAPPSTDPAALGSDRQTGVNAKETTDIHRDPTKLAGRQPEQEEMAPPANLVPEREAYIPFSKAIEFGSGVLTRKRLERAIEKGEPCKVRDRIPRRQRREVHVQDMMRLIKMLSSSDDDAAEIAARMFGEYKQTSSKKRTQPDLS